jgi:hypothetical protein
MNFLNRSITKVNKEEIYRPVSYTGRNLLDFPEKTSDASFK